MRLAPAVLAVLASTTTPVGAAAQAFPVKLTVAGDSLSQGFAADGTIPFDQPWNSWAYGINGDVRSVWSRYRARNPFMLVEPVSRTGADMIGDFAAQAARICAQSIRPNRAYVLLGQNDVCGAEPSAGPDAAANVPSVDAFVAALRAGLTQLAACLPRGSVVEVLSIVRVDFLFEAGLSQNLFYCPAVWQAANICRIVTGEPDPARRAQIGARIDAWNAAMAQEVSDFDARLGGRNPRGLRFVTDWEGSIAEGRQDTSVGTHVFGPEDIDALDCFHASITGQRKIACVAWAKSPDGSGTAPACFP